MEGTTRANRDRRELKKSPKTWEIWQAYIPKLEEGIRSHAQNGHRPVLIISNNEGNNTSTEVNIFAFSSKTEKFGKIPVHVLVEKSDGNGLKCDSILLCEAADTIPKSCLKYRMGAIDDESVSGTVREATRKQFGILNH